LADADTVAHYPLHAAPGATTARDVSGNALHATVVGGVTSGAVACR
jgi:hypothetical protein